MGRKETGLKKIPRSASIAVCVSDIVLKSKKDALGFVDRGINKEISFMPEVASQVCRDCKKCFPLCPTAYLQAAFVLTQSLAFPSTPDKTNLDESDSKE